jgi:hypothetical protein
MPLAVLVLALVAYGYALISYPEFRRPGLIGGALIAAGLAVYFVRNPSEADLAATRIRTDEVVLDELTLERTPNGATLSGRVRNGSERYRLRDLTLVLRLRDCPTAETAPAECPVIGEAQAIARPDVPPGQIRALSAHFTFRNLPPVTGTLAWDGTIAATRATPD